MDGEFEGSDRLRRDLIARVMTELCVRNSVLEDLHTGTAPSSASGDYSDVRVVTPYGEIPWNELSRLSNEEMKVLMKDVVDRMFTYLSYPEELAFLVGAKSWDRPRLHAGLMRVVLQQRRLERANRRQGLQ